MGELIDLLVFRLSDKGVDPTHVPRVIKDVLNIVKDGGDFTVSNVNNRVYPALLRRYCGFYLVTCNMGYLR